jgi:hypothetical protein
MSALGHKRTLRRVFPMSAIPPKADIRQLTRLPRTCTDRPGLIPTDHPRCAIAENPCISSIGNGNTIMDVRSPAMSNSVLR